MDWPYDNGGDLPSGAVTVRNTIGEPIWVQAAVDEMLTAEENALRWLDGNGPEPTCRSALTCLAPKPPAPDA